MAGLGKGVERWEGGYVKESEWLSMISEGVILQASTNKKWVAH